MWQHLVPPFKKFTLNATATLHFITGVRRTLNEKFPAKLIGRNE
jgi:hypothetical protein